MSSSCKPKDFRRARWGAFSVPVLISSLLNFEYL
jgi:hypothetical protein